MSTASGSSPPGLGRRVNGFLGLWAVLFTIWLCISSSLQADIVVSGAVVAAVLACVFVASGEVWTEIRWTPRGLYHFLAYTGVFCVELVRANINMMRYVYAPRIAIRPGIIKIRTRLKSPVGRLALANSIALTPGSLVMDMTGDTLFIHLLDVETMDIDAASQAVAGPFETHLEAVFG